VLFVVREHSRFGTFNFGAVMLLRDFQVGDSMILGTLSGCSYGTWSRRIASLQPDCSMGTFSFYRVQERCLKGGERILWQG